MILVVEGRMPSALSGILLLTVLAGVYSFFSPKQLTAINAIQSNGAQLAIMSASASTMLAYSPGAPFYCLFAVMGLDLFLSMTSFLNDHGSLIREESDIAMSFLSKSNRM